MRERVAAGSMDTLTRGDERAAGVISGADPYRELELYLEKVSVSLYTILLTHYIYTVTGITYPKGISD